MAAQTSLENLENDMVLINNMLNDSLEEIKKCELEIIIQSIKNLHKKRKRATKDELMKRVDITEEDFMKTMETLVKDNVIEIKYEGTNRESIRLTQKEKDASPGKGRIDEENARMNTVEESVRILDLKIGRLEESYRTLSAETVVEGLRSENNFLRSEIRELTSLLDVFADLFSRQNQSSGKTKTCKDFKNIINGMEIVNDNSQSENIISNESVGVNETADDNDNDNDDDIMFTAGNNINDIMCTSENTDTKESYIDINGEFNFNNSISNNSQNKNLDVEEQLLLVRKKYKNDFYEHAKPAQNSTGKLESQCRVWKTDTVLIAGDSILLGIEENRLRTKFSVKVRSFPGATIDDMYSYLIPLLEKQPKVLILHVGTNDAPKRTSQEIINSLLNLKSFIAKKLPDCNIIISTPVKRTDDGKAMLTIKKVSEIACQLELNTIDNSNINENHLGKKGLHLNRKGTGRLVLNFLNKIKNTTL